jgi:hypothetical protein
MSTAAATLGLTVLSLCSCSTASPEPPPTPPPPTGVFFTGAGDIAECGTGGAEATARLLDGIPGLVWTTGDNAYPSGSAADFDLCYDPTWGRHRNRTRPTPGNHEYWTPGALPYFRYFGDAAGTAGEGWYSYTYGGWRIIALNSNVETGWGSDQIRWLRQALSDDPHRCTLAYFHHPLVSSSAHADRRDAAEYGDVRPFWILLHAAGADVVLNGHDHHYERFAPITPAGTIDRVQGARQFIVGTGGGALRGRGPELHPASEKLHDGTHGVLKLELGNGRYAWEFIDAAGTVLDSGSEICH